MRILSICVEHLSKFKLEINNIPITYRSLRFCARCLYFLYRISCKYHKICFTTCRHEWVVLNAIVTCRFFLEFLFHFQWNQSWFLWPIINIEFNYKSMFYRNIYDGDDVHFFNWSHKMLCWIVRSKKFNKKSSATLLQRGQLDIYSIYLSWTSIRFIWFKDCISSVSRCCMQYWVIKISVKGDGFQE